MVFVNLQRATRDNLLVTYLTVSSTFLHQVIIQAAITVDMVTVCLNRDDHGVLLTNWTAENFELFTSEIDQFWREGNCFML